MQNIFRSLNLLSIDVAVGAMVCALWFTRLLGAGPRPYAITSLGLTVWIIYTCDHLLDAKRLTQTASTARHRFHQEHFRIITVFVCIATAVTATLMFFMKFEVLLGGLLLAVIVGGYFKIQSHLKTVKEVCGALLYFSGIIIPSAPILVSPGPSTILLALQFLCTVQLNLILFSWFDHENDVRDHRVSIITTVGTRTGARIIIFLFIIEAVISIALMLSGSSMISSIISITMPALLLILFINKRYFSLHDRYRYVGDGIFFIPVLCLLTS